MRTRAPGRRRDGSAAPAHDRAKPRALPLDLPFWVDLGIADERHRLVPSMARKWKQIDKFLEVLEHALDDAGLTAADPPPRVVDFGCGKGYLTFAVHEYLRRRFGGAPEVTGVELRADLVALCNAAAARAHCEGLRFVQGDLRSFVPEAVDVMIALHACDTATDHALDLGLRAGARILVASPCCHKELRPQLTSPKPLAPLLRHGIHLGQEAEMLTDGLRALALEAVRLPGQGVRVRVAGAHQQEQDDPGHPACRATPARRRAGPRPRRKASRPSTASASSAWSGCCASAAPPAAAPA